MAEVVSDAGYVMVSPSNTSPVLTNPDIAWKPGYLRTAHNDKVQGKAMADFAWDELGARSAAAIHDGDPYTEGLAKVFADSFEARGGDLQMFTAVGKGDTDMRPVLTAVAAAGPPDVIYYPIFTAECGFVTKQAKEVAGLESTILSAADGCISDTAAEAIGEVGEGTYFSGPDTDFLGGTYKKFLNAYVEKVGKSPTSVFHAHSYDATMLILNCVEEVAAQEDDGTIHVGRQDMRDCLYATNNYEGITGLLNCNQYGDCADAKIVVKQLTKGNYIQIWAAQ
jgi:branched-chain amino acid transport system substrate-binding protein